MSKVWCVNGRLGELEDAVMARLWEWQRPATVREVLEDLGRERPLAYTTVLTVLDHLYRKGFATRSLEGRAFKYRAVGTRAEHAACLMKEAWATSDNPSAVLVALIGMMSPQQRAAFQEANSLISTSERGAP